MLWVGKAPPRPHLRTRGGGPVTRPAAPSLLPSSGLGLAWALPTNGGPANHVLLCMRIFRQCSTLDPGPSTSNTAIDRPPAVACPLARGSGTPSLSLACEAHGPANRTGASPDHADASAIATELISTGLSDRHTCIHTMGITRLIRHAEAQVRRVSRGRSVSGRRWQSLDLRL